MKRSNSNISRRFKKELANTYSGRLVQSGIFGQQQIKLTGKEDFCICVYQGSIFVGYIKSVSQNNLTISITKQKEKSKKYKGFSSCQNAIQTYIQFPITSLNFYSYVIKLR